MTFQLDTSGAVHGVIASDGDLCAYLWSDISPFTQGYIEAALTNLLVERETDNKGQTLSERWAAFSDLAPETLARIIADCEAAPAIYKAEWPDIAAAGRRFWLDRHYGVLAVIGDSLRPQIVQLGDDGLVRFA